MTRGAGLLIVLGLASLCANAQVDASDNPVCMKASGFAVPRRDEPTAAERERLKGCSALDLYYGVGQAADYRKARACAYTMRAADAVKQEESGGDGIEAPAVLAMVYAGGRGVAPDLGLAVKFSCELRGVWDDGTGEAVALEGIRASGGRRADVDFCKDDPGRWMNYYCITRDGAWVNASVKREERLARRTGSPEARKAFLRLERARRTYLDAHGPEEPNGTTGRVQTALRDEVDEEQRWLAMLRAVNAGKAPEMSEAAFPEADDALNAAYRGARRMARESGSGEYGNPTEEQTKKAERAWLRYREAWVEYGRLRAPGVAADRWRVGLTVERTEALGG